jgi:GDPmannose 4,6-dehydratase
MPRALIIGHAGQDGRILWDQLAARGFSLVGISRSTVRAWHADWNAAVDVTDAQAVRAFMADFAPEQIYYLAAHHHSSQDTGSGDADAWEESWNVHVHGFANVLRAARESSPDVRVFYASSSRVFGEAITSPQDESTPLRPVCIYGVTKVSAMVLADYYRRTHGLFVSCGILFNHESPLRGAQFVSQRVVGGLNAIKSGHAESLQVGSLGARVDWGYAPDYTRAMQLILESGQAGDFVIATGRTHSVRDMVAIAAEYLGIEWEGRVVETARILKRAPQELCGDASRLRRLTGWEPSVDFREMIHILVDATKSRQEAGSSVPSEG